MTKPPNNSLERPGAARAYLRVLALMVLGLVVVGAVVANGGRSDAATDGGRLAGAGLIGKAQLDVLLHTYARSRAQRVRLEPAPLTAELRKKGYNECNPHDPMGWGPYLPFVRCGMGWIAVPQRGGHTPDYGYDVIVHFHGAPPLRKTLVQVARGVVFVGVDLGIGSGKYSDAFLARESFPEFRRTIEASLKRRSGQSEAYIRHLALSAWSAGYGAVNEILKHGDEGIDAVVLLDALHAGWEPGRNRDRTVKSISRVFIAPTIEFARRALHGEKIFVFTHSYVDPVTYPSTSLTAKLLLQELGVSRKEVRIPARFLTQDGAVDQAGLHVWSYRGHDELTHCAHLPLISRVLNDILEQQWETPEMDRNVPTIKTD